MKKISEKQLLILLGVPALAVFIFIVYSMFLKNPADSEKNNPQNKTDKSSGLVLPAVKDDTVNKSKSTVYEDIANKEAQEKENDRVKSSKDFFSMNDKKNDDNENVSNNANSNSQANNTTVKKTAQAKHFVNSKIKTTESANNKGKENNSSEDNNYGFGVYQNNNSNNKIPGHDSVTKNKEFIPAILEKSMKIRNGSEVIFILQKSTTIEGIYFEKMSIMYGTANFNNDRLDITINTIQDKAGTKYIVNLTGYNENYQKGIFYSDRVESSVNQSKSNVLSSTAGVLGSKIGGTAGQVINETVQGASNSLNNQKAEINISQGYKMYFK